jgi:hypothetical protein
LMPLEDLLFWPISHDMDRTERRRHQREELQATKQTAGFRACPMNTRRREGRQE